MDHERFGLDMLSLSFALCGELGTDLFCNIYCRCSCCSAYTRAHILLHAFLLFVRMVLFLIAAVGKMTGSHQFLPTVGILRRKICSASCSQAKRQWNTPVCVSKKRVSLLAACQIIRRNLTAASGWSTCSLFVHVWCECAMHANLILPLPSFNSTREFIFNFPWLPSRDFACIVWF